MPLVCVFSPGFFPGKVGLKCNFGQELMCFWPGIKISEVKMHHFSIIQMIKLMVATCLPERKTSNTGIIYQTVSEKKERTNAGTQKGLNRQHAVETPLKLISKQ